MSSSVLQCPCTKHTKLGSTIRKLPLAQWSLRPRVSSKLSNLGNATQEFTSALDLNNQSAETLLISIEYGDTRFKDSALRYSIYWNVKPDKIPLSIL